MRFRVPRSSVMRGRFIRLVAAACLRALMSGLLPNPRRALRVGLFET